MSFKIANSTTTHKTFCKVCHDAGKDFAEYTSHRVKDSSGKVICPTLLSQNCRGCSKSGHTIKFCPLVLQREKHVERQSRIESFQLAEEQKRKNVAPNKYASIVGGGFAVLAESSKTKKVKKQVKVKEVKEVKEELFPQLSQSNITVQITVSTSSPSAFSYSDALKNVKPSEKPEPKPIARVAHKQSSIYKKINWADIYDSDDDELTPLSDIR